RGGPAPEPVPFDFQQVVDEADIGLCIIQDGRLEYVNPKYAQMHGYAPHELTGTNFLAVVHPDDRATVMEVRRLRDEGRHDIPYVTRSLHRDGSTFHVRVSGRNITYRGRRASLTTLGEISDLVTAQRVSEWRARMLLSNELLCRSGSIEIVPDLAQVRVSAGARTLLQAGPQASCMSLRHALRAVPAEDRGRVLMQWRRAVPDRPFEFRHGLRRADGSVIRVLHRGLIEVVDGDMLRPVAILQDITEQASAQATIERLVNYHPVTGLPTMHLLLRRMSAAVDVAVRDNLPLALVYLRFPDVERVHESMGIGAAEALDTTLAARLIAAVRTEDTAAHLGSGDFALLLDPTAGGDEAQALQFATRLLASLAEPVLIDGIEFMPEGQAGIAQFPGDATTAEALLENAHTACGRGGARISFFTREIGETVARRIRLESALRRAFERRELLLHYQPQVNLRDGAIIGVEALLRWNSETFGSVSPAEFIPIAEASGLIVPLGEWVFRLACEQSVAWSRAGLPPLRIGVNLSPRQLEQADISERLQRVLVETGADPRNLGIEVTESVMMRDFEHARRTLCELSAIGIEIALDDFGTGYSNLGALRSLPFDVLKIDRSLVHDVTAAPEDVAIARSVLMLAKGLKLKVLAEGVETEGQLALLQAHGCDLMQGFLFSKPLPAADLEQMVRDGVKLPERLQKHPSRQRTLLIVDDEESVLSSLRRLLRGAGYQIVIARSGEEGLARLAEHDVDVIVSDQRMPGMTGVEFLRRAKALYPDTVRIVLSGYTELTSITDAINEGAIYKFLTKPWDDAQLREHIAEAFRTKNLTDENRRLSNEVRRANEELAVANERQQRAIDQQCERLSLEEIRAVNAQDLVERLPTAVIGIDTDGTIAFINQQARALLQGWPALLGCPADQVLPVSWRETWRTPGGSPRHTRIANRDCQVSCAEVPGRGHLLSVVPVSPFHPEEVST
ncbi:MAG: EAL domain-containing protein, partial [Rhizobacter sp.]